MQAPLHVQCLDYIYALARQPDWELPRSDGDASSEGAQTAQATREKADSIRQYVMDIRMYQATLSAVSANLLQQSAQSASAAASSQSKATAHEDKKSAKRPQKKNVRRCSSPSHFNVPESEEIKYGPEHTLDLPGRHLVDTLMRSVSGLYYKRKHTGTATYVAVGPDYGVHHYGSLDLLLSPIRKRHTIEEWTPREMALFESCICRHGKDFDLMSKTIGSKTTRQCVEFYYRVWKRSKHYCTWKSSCQHRDSSSGTSSRPASSKLPATAASTMTTTTMTVGHDVSRSSTNHRADPALSSTAAMAVSVERVHI